MSERPPFAVGDRVRCVYRKDPAHQSRGVVTKVRDIGLCWAVYARGTTRGGKPAHYVWWHHTVVLDSTDALSTEKET